MRDPRDTGLVDVLEQDDELVAAETRRGVGVADARGQPGRGLAQELVPGDVAEGVVDVLEHVEVDEQQRSPGARAGRAGQGVLEPVDEQEPVREPGERVVEGLVDRVLDRLRIGEGQARVLGKGDQHLALGLRVAATRLVRGDDEAANDLPMLVHGRSESGADPVGRERPQAVLVGGVVLDHDQLARCYRPPAGTDADRAAVHLLRQLGVDPGRGDEQQLLAIVGVAQPQAHRLVAEQVHGARDDRVQHLVELAPADDRPLNLRQPL